MSGFHIRHPHDRPQRQCEMRRRHGVHVIDFAVRASPIVKRSAIPARHPGFFKNWFSARGHLDPFVLILFRGRSWWLAWRARRRSLRTGSWDCGRWRHLYLRPLMSAATAQEENEE